jgi:hypothetical protein
VEHFVTSKPDNDSYRWFRYLVLVSLLAIGCVELNPGPNSAKVRSTKLLTLSLFMIRCKFHRERYRLNIIKKEEIYTPF